MDGDVIGINTAILSPSGGSIGIGFAVPSALAAPVIDQLTKFGETRRGWLGVRIQNVDDAIAESLGLGKARGALVAGIDEKGPAKPAGIEAGDVIVKFDGIEIKELQGSPAHRRPDPGGQGRRRPDRAQGQGNHRRPSRSDASTRARRWPRPTCHRRKPRSRP